MHIVSSNDQNQANYNDFVKTQIVNDLEILYFFLESIITFQFIQNISGEINKMLTVDGIFEIISNHHLKQQHFNNLISNSCKKSIDKIPLILSKDKSEMMTIIKVMENIFKKIKNLDLPFNDQFLNLNIFKYMNFLLAENCEIFDFSYAKYLFKLLKYSYVSKELPKAKHYCKCLEKIHEKLKNPGNFLLWKAKIEFKSGNYMEAIKVLTSKNSKIMIKCRLKLFKYYLKSEFYSKNYVIMTFQGFLKE